MIADKPLTEYVPLVPRLRQGRHHHAVVDERRRSGRPAEDGLSRPAQPDDSAQGGRSDRADDGRTTSIRSSFPLDDQPTFALLQRGETKGVFQLESGGIRDLLQRMKPDHFHDIIATNALYRPGPLEGGMVDDYVAVKHGRKAAEYKHPVLEGDPGRNARRDGLPGTGDADSESPGRHRTGQGLHLHQGDQQEKGSADRRELREVHRRLRRPTDWAKKDAEEIWNLIVKFAGYGFNKSHSTAYALIAYQTAYLKTHYPVEFMAALLSGDIPGRNFKKKDSLVEHMEDCERMGIEVVPPDVNHSDVDFSVAEGKIFFALSAIKGCGGGAAEAIVGRTEDGRTLPRPVRLLRTCRSRLPATAPTIETLIKAGAIRFIRSPPRPTAWPSWTARCNPAPPRWPTNAPVKKVSSATSRKISGVTPVVALPDIPEIARTRKAADGKGGPGLLSDQPSAG